MNILNTAEHSKMVKVVNFIYVFFTTITKKKKKTKQNRIQSGKAISVSSKTECKALKIINNDSHKRNNLTKKYNSKHMNLKQSLKTYKAKTESPQ